MASRFCTYGALLHYYEGRAVSWLESWREPIGIKIMDASSSIQGFMSVTAVKGMGSRAIILCALVYSYSKLCEGIENDAAMLEDFKRLANLENRHLQA